MQVDFNADNVATGNQLTVTIHSINKVNVDSDISGDNSEWDLSESQIVPLGKVISPGCFGICIADGDDNFLSFVIITPAEPGLFAIEHQDISPPPPPADAQPFSSDILGKFLYNLTADRLTSAVQKSAATFPADYAVSLGATVAICTVSIALLQPEFCFASVAANAIDFAANINDILIEDMVTDMLLSDGEGTFLKMLWGVRTLTVDVVNITNDAVKVDLIIDSLQTASDATDLVTTDNNVQFGVRSASDLTTKSLIFYKFLR